MPCNCSPTICHIIPPHMLESMMKSPDEKVRDCAVSNITGAERARAARRTLAEIRPQMFRAVALNLSTKKDRVIHDAKKRPNLAGKVVRKEGSSQTKDKEVDEAYRFSGYVYDFLGKILNRNSIDDQGMSLKSSVRYREDPARPYNNAFWSNQQMAYGDGDGVVFKRFTSSIDVIGHELFHGVVEHTANLEYKSEPGALNESYADIFGSLVKQWQKKQTAKQANWLIGEDLIHLAPTRKALRSLKAPGTAYENDPHLRTDPQPAHMDDKYTGFLDDQGVHINSGIPNRAFYLAAIEIGGRAWEKAGKIWYDTLLRALKSDSNFEDCAKGTYISSGMMFGQGSLEQKAIKKAWDKVGLSI
jgi:Zn-dependent metalloprotease